MQDKKAEPYMTGYRGGADQVLIKNEFTDLTDPKARAALADEATEQMTLGDRAAAALKAAGEQAMCNSNMGQIEAYRINHVISLIEREVAAERERCAEIAENHECPPESDDSGYAAFQIAAKIRSGK